MFPSLKRLIVPLATGVLLVSAGPAAADVQLDAPWAGNGTVASDGTASAPRFDYSVNDSTGSWSFTTTASSARSVPVVYSYSGFHAWFAVRVKLERFVRRGDAEIVRETLAEGGPANCCSAPSGGFSYSGKSTFDVQPGDVYGYQMSGSNGDSDRRLIGTLKLRAPDETAPELTVPSGLTAETTNPSGAAVALNGLSALDAIDETPEITCDPASGSMFPIGTTTVSCTASDDDGNTSAPKTFDVVVKRLVPVDGDIRGTVPATLSLSLGAPARFAPFTPGTAQDYEASATANVISSAGDAALTVADPSGTTPGHLRNGSFAMPSALQARAGSDPYAAVSGTATTLKRYDAPVSNDAVALGFRQHVGATDALRTGTYAKSLTFTLSTTTP